ncbi:putative efflux pump antibiotic resistance protein [Podospora didyma]|uniref:Efflux pump antibiotic resistance protein n=1 Tax=Podospora didyma TaxID=330526 RepID=A0AAE0NGU8_9PEZI|nr:putative efflux pump antibiotic resistance protein [Podospora didyma]
MTVNSDSEATEKTKVAGDQESGGSTTDLEAGNITKQPSIVKIKSENDEPADDDRKAPTESSEYPKGIALLSVVAAVIITVFLTSLDQTIVGTAIPKITDEFHGLEQVSWYGSAYFMCLGGFQPAWGKAFKYFPIKMTFIVSIAVFEIGSLICGVSPNSNAFIVGRAIAGVGGAGINVGCALIFAFIAPPEKRPSLMGFIGVAYTIAAICGPLIGGAFADRVTWRWCFYINLPVGGVALFLIYFFFHTPSFAQNDSFHGAGWKEKALHMDPLGIVLSMGSIISFILALQYGGVTHAWSSSTVIGLLVGSVLILLALLAWEFIFAGEYAMLPARLIKQRNIWAPSIFQAFFSGCYFLLLFYLPIYFQSIKGVDAVQSGVDNLPLVIAGCLAIISGGIVVTKTRHVTPFMLAGAAISAICCGLLYTLDEYTPSAKWIGYQILLGVAIAFPFQNALNIVQANTNSDDISTASATLFFFQILGGAYSVSAAQSAFVNRLIGSLAVNVPGLNPMIVVGTGASELRRVFPPELLPGIVVAYMDGLRASFAVAIGLASVAFLSTALVPWKRLPVGSVGEGVAMG